jgi:hypothetical protein
VGDEEPKIRKGLVSRFYERVTIYWMTQFNEITLAGLTAVVAVYAFVGQGARADPRHLLNTLLVATGLFCFNRLLVRTSRAGVRRATATEIAEIHSSGDLMGDLERRLKTLCAEYKIPF